MELAKITCEKCGYTWVRRVENPVKCPKCGHTLKARVCKKEGAGNG